IDLRDVPDPAGECQVVPAEQAFEPVAFVAHAVAANALDAGKRRRRNDETLRHASPPFSYPPSQLPASIATLRLRSRLPPAPFKAPREAASRNWTGPSDGGASTARRAGSPAMRQRRGPRRR